MSKNWFFDDFIYSYFLNYTSIEFDMLFFEKLYLYSLESELPISIIVPKGIVRVILKLNL